MSKFKPDFIDTKAKKIFVIIEAVLCLFVFIPFYLHNNWVVGFTADSSGNAAVVVGLPYGGIDYFYIYDNNGVLVNYKTLQDEGVRGVALEDDMICLYAENKDYYDFTGKLRKKGESYSYSDLPDFENEIRVGDTVYKFSMNLVGYETVKMHTPEKTITLYSDMSHYLVKLFVGAFVGFGLMIMLFAIVFPPPNNIN